MSRILHPVALKGSQRWLQLAVNHCPTVIDRAIRCADIGLSNSIEWMSPLESDDFAEYQDSAFANRLGISLERRALSAFWPTGARRIRDSHATRQRSISWSATVSANLASQGVRAVALRLAAPKRFRRREKAPEGRRETATFHFPRAGAVRASGTPRRKPCCHPDG